MSPGVARFVLGSLLVLAACAPEQSPPEKHPPPPRSGPPNVLILYVDDMGYGDLGLTGSTTGATPSIDALAREGIFFRNGYSTACVCSPARVALLTGRYQQRFGFEANVSTIPRPVEALDPAARTIADRFKELGYATGIVGKWHIGSASPEHLPNARGFDEFYGILPHEIAPKNKESVPVWRNGEEVPVPENHMLAFGAEARSFIERHAASPWMLYCAFTAVHSPFEFPKAYKTPFEKLERPQYLAMLSLLDDVVAGILAELREQGLEENTLVFLASDNGAPPRSGDNGPYAGFKFSLDEGGIRAPLIVRWKGHIPAGQERSELVTQLDVLPTALAAAGIQPPSEWGLDGADLLPLARGETEVPPHPALFWRFGVQFAVREGPWKLVRTGLQEPVRLFDVDRDPGETDDRYQAEPERVARLQGLWDGWNAGNRPPLWEDLRWNRVPDPAPAQGQH